MSLRKLIRQHDGSMIAVDSQSIADYAARIAREHGSALRQSKQSDGGWELHVSEGAIRRRKRLRSKN